MNAPVKQQLHGAADAQHSIGDPDAIPKRLHRAAIQHTFGGVV
jgi:hypothetical protein